MNNNLNFIAEVFAFIYYGGQVRFRVYVNEGKVEYRISDHGFDSKIEAMTKYNVSRSGTCNELLEHHNPSKKVHLEQVFEEILPLIPEDIFKQIGGMITQEARVYSARTIFFIFPVNK